MNHRKNIPIHNGGIDFRFQTDHRIVGYACHELEEGRFMINQFMINNCQMIYHINHS